MFFIFAAIVSWLLLGFLGAMLWFYDTDKPVVYADELLIKSSYGVLLLIPMLYRAIRKLFRRIRAYLCSKAVFRKNVNICCDDYYS